MAAQDTKTAQIIEAVQRAGAALDSGGSQIATAMSHAEHVRGRTITAGFHGVAQSLVGVVDSLKKLHSQLAGLAEKTKIATVPLLEITDELTLGQVMEKLTAAGEILATAQRGIAAAAADIEQVEQRVVAALAGGQPGPLVSILKNGRESILQAVQYLDTAKQKASEALAEAEQAGN